MGLRGGGRYRSVSYNEPQEGYVFWGTQEIVVRELPPGALCRGHPELIFVEQGKNIVVRSDAALDLAGT